MDGKATQMWKKKFQHDGIPVSASFLVLVFDRFCNCGPDPAMPEDFFHLPGDSGSLFQDLKKNFWLGGFWLWIS
jgi:hypothetical protein